jgi:hypothetical protein
MIVAIDGTGPDSSDDYAREMGGSFCSQIGRAANAIYFRGPTLTGSETSAIANLAVGRGDGRAWQGVGWRGDAGWL